MLKEEGKALSLTDQTDAWTQMCKQRVKVFNHSWVADMLVPKRFLIISAKEVTFFIPG